MDSELRLFIPLFKVDSEKRLIYGRLTEETPDSAGEIFDYETSKPYIESWTGYFAKATDGKSYGNLRAMHDSKKAIGILPEVHLSDRDKAVDIVAKVVDDDEWAKCEEGVYTGFSMGGKYIRRWPDGKHTRFTAQPSEASLADYPMHKKCTFQMVKADGVVEERSFKKAAEPGLADILAKADTLNDRAVTDLVFKYMKAPEIDAQWSREEAIDALKKVAERKDTNPDQGKSKYGDVKFADEKNKKYPIDTADHIRAAWNYINKGKNAAKYSEGDVKTIMAKIIGAWKAKIDKEGPPSASEDSKKVEALTGDLLAKAEIDVSPLPSFKTLDEIKKYAGEEISDALTAAYCLQSIYYLWQKEKGEGEADQADSLKSTIKALRDFIAAEILEENEPESKPKSEVAMAQKAEDLAKTGKKHSKETLEKVQALHDQSMDLGAKCFASCAKCGSRFGMPGDMKCEKCGTSSPSAATIKAEAERDDALRKIDTLNLELKAGEARVLIVSEERDQAIRKSVELASRLTDLVGADAGLKKVSDKLDLAEKRIAELTGQLDGFQKADSERKEAETKAAQERQEATVKENEALKKAVAEKDDQMKKVMALAAENEVLKGKEKERAEALEKVTALTTERDALVKELTTTKTDLEKIMAQPEPAKGALKSIPISKAEDSAGTGTTIKAEEPKTPEEAIKKVHAGGAMIGFPLGGGLPALRK
jgi:hypothetical protein